jgi:hypothetical protein
MQNSLTPNMILQRLRLLLRAARCGQLSRAGEKRSSSARAPCCGGYNALFVISRQDGISSRS